MLGNMKFISRVEQDILFNTLNKFHISAHPCIILSLYIYQGIDTCLLLIKIKEYVITTF